MKSICAAIAICLIPATVEAQLVSVVTSFAWENPTAATSKFQATVSSLNAGPVSLWIHGGSPDPTGTSFDWFGTRSPSSVTHTVKVNGVDRVFYHLHTANVPAGPQTVKSTNAVTPGAVVPVTYALWIVHGGQSSAPGAVEPSLDDPDDFELGESFDDVTMPDLQSKQGQETDALVGLEMGEGSPSAVANNAIVTWNVPGQSPMTYRLGGTLSGTNMFAGLPTFGRPSNWSGIAADYSTWRTYFRTCALGLIYLGAFRRCVNVLLVA
jgi:hypothetical protein